MKKEIENEMLEILDDYWTETNTTKLTIDKILSLFEKFLESQDGDISMAICDYEDYRLTTGQATTKIIQNIKNKLKE